MSRLQPGVKLVEVVDGRPGLAVDLDQLLKKAGKEAFEMEAVVGQSSPLTCRVICLPVPPEVANQRRRKAKQLAHRRGRVPNQATLRRLDWNLFITNVGRTILSTASVAIVYRVRWSVELTFKRWKSHYHLDRIKGQRRERVWCEFYAKLIGLVLFQLMVGPLRVLALAQSQRELSVIKTLKLFRQAATQIPQQLRSAPTLTQTLSAKMSQILHYGLRERRVKNPSTYQILQRQAQFNGICWVLEHPVQYIHQTKRRSTADEFRQWLTPMPTQPLRRVLNAA